MGFFRRNEETLNEKLLREAGLGRRPAEESHVQVPPPGPSSIYVPRASSWDVTATVRASGISGTEARFVTLPTGDVIVDVETGDGDLSPLADAVERQLKPPYRAQATRLHEDLWGITADPIDVREFSCDAGDDVEVICRSGEISVTVDGEPSELRIPQLEQSGEYAAHATRIDGDFWEVEAHPL